MTNSPIELNAIIAAARASILSISTDAFTSTLNAHDDASDFAETDLIELRDDIDSAIAIHLNSDADDDAINAFCAAYDQLIIDNSRIIFDAILDAIEYRAALI